MRCIHCDREISQAFEKALDGTYAVVNRDDKGGWVCPVTGNEHEPAPWFIVVTRFRIENMEPIYPYVVGPYPTQGEAEEEGNSDSGIIYSLLTIDAENEGYIADDVYWTTNPPEGIRITPTE